MPDPISKAQEEEMSSALIAQLLAEDALYQGGIDYYYDDNNTKEEDDSYEDNSEDEFDPRKKGRINHVKKEVMKRGRKRKMMVTKVVEGEEEEEERQEGEEGQKIKESCAINKKPRKPVPEGYNTGVYTELEEKNFLEGLELFGRDWTKLQAHVATRDANSIRSHAQKHFIKMFRDNIPLPPKVKETGDGYTLSGKPLDPNSAAAKPYLKSMVANKMDKVERQTKELNIAEDKSLTNTFDKASDSTISDKENIKSSEPDSQPYQITVHSNALLTMDFHAHLMATKVVGFLAGEWDKETKYIVVREAYPCIESKETNPVSAIEVRQQIEKRDLKVVGWYHLSDDSQCALDQHDELLIDAVVCPYRDTIESVRWFQTKDSNNDKPLLYNIQENETMSDELLERLLNFMQAASIEKETFNEKWKQDTDETKLEKMILTIRSHMPWIQKGLNEPDKEDIFLEKVKQAFMK